MEAGLQPQRLVAELTKSTHGDLAAYLPIARQATTEMPEFLARLIAWNRTNGSIRDSKVALPVASLVPGFEYAENSLAHLVKLDPREFVKAISFAKPAEAKGPKTANAVGYKRKIRKLTERYLRVREANPGWFIRAVLTHRASMRWLYAVQHVRPNPWADSVLFKGVRPPGSPLEAVARLRDMAPRDAAIAIVKHGIPFPVAVSALGAKAKDTDLVMALIDQMTP